MMRGTRYWKPREWERAKELREQGRTYVQIAEELGIDYHRVAMKFNNEGFRLRLESGAPNPHGPPPKLLIERERRHRAALAQSLTQHVFGDPPPGYSALDKKRREQNL